MKRLLILFAFTPLFTQAITPTFTCGFECGDLTGVGSHWGTSGGAISTTTINNGLRSLRLNSTASGVYASHTVTSGNLLVVRCYVYFVTLPNVDCNIVTGNINIEAFFQVSDSKIYAKAGLNLGATGILVTTGQWYLLDVRLNTTSNPWLADVQVNGSAAGQASAGNAATPMTAVVLGNNVTNYTADIFFDDVMVSTTTGDYPMGGGKVLGFVPSSDGTHTSTTTHTVKGTAAAPTGGGSITSATTDAFNWINARPIGGGATDATRLINAQTAASTEYVEFGIEQTTETAAPRAVEILVIDQQAATQSGDMHIKINDNGTETVILDRTNVAGVASDRFTTKQFATMPTGGSAWTLTRFKAIKIRFGYSADATPDQYFRGAMVEAEFAEVPVTPHSRRINWIM